MATEIVIYTQSPDPLSQVWVEALRARGIPFVQRNIGHDAAVAAELRSLGPVATPTTVVDGRRHTGFDPDLLDRLSESRA